MTPNDTASQGHRSMNTTSPGDGARRHRPGYRPARARRSRRCSAAALLACCVALAGCASLVRPNYETELAELREGQYTLDPTHAYLLFKADHLGLSKVVGRFDEIDASLDFDPEDVASLRLDGVVATASIDTGDASLDDRLAGGDWLDAEAHPEARFTTTSVTPGEGDRFTVTGDFTLRGVTREITLDARFGGGADNLLTGRYTLGFEATGEISRSEYGIDSFGALVGDAIELEIHAEFQREG